MTPADTQLRERIFIKVDELLHASQKGLSSYAGTDLRVAVLLCIEDDPKQLRIIDPYRILESSKGALKEYFQDPLNRGFENSAKLGNRLHNDRIPEISGMVAYAQQSQSIHYQIWFAERPTDISHENSIRHWLASAARSLSYEVALGCPLHTQSAKIALENYSLYAVEHSIATEYAYRRQKAPHRDLMSILETVAEISLAKEEAAPTTGEIIFTDAEYLQNQLFQLEFSPRPLLRNHKHLSKLLHGLWKGVCLLSCGHELWGISRDTDLPYDLFLRVVFQSGIAAVFLAGQSCSPALEICTVNLGRYQARHIQARLPGLKGVLLDSGLDEARAASVENNLSILCSEIAGHHHGATIVLETSDSPLTISGQHVTPTQLDIPALRALSEVDGALHLNREGRLKAFGCLLDGMSSLYEDRARGSRFNSALRFTETHADCLVIVVSSDGPITVFWEGRRLGAGQLRDLREYVEINPPLFDAWSLQP